LVALVGEGIAQRDSMLCAVKDHIREGLTGTEAALALGALSSFGRLNATRCLESSTPPEASIEPNDEAESHDPEPQPGAQDPGFLGSCGTGPVERGFLGDYLCFASTGAVAPVQGAVCAVTVFATFRPVYFGAACTQHDSCYGRLGSRKSQCDLDFLSLMEVTCDETLPGDSWLKGRQTCRGAAVAAYETVRSLGCRAFTSAQLRAGSRNPTCD
jgi:hypothetical protein